METMVSDRVPARASGRSASSQAWRHVGDPILSTHWIPLSFRAQATGVTVGEKRLFLIRQAFHSACDNMRKMHILLTAHMKNRSNKKNTASVRNVKTDT